MDEPPNSNTKSGTETFLPLCHLHNWHRRLQTTLLPRQPSSPPRGPDITCHSVEEGADQREDLIDLQILPELAGLRRCSPPSMGDVSGWLTDIIRRQVKENQDDSFVWEDAIAKIDQDNKRPALQEENRSSAEEGNDAMMILANVIKYAMWKASRLQPRVGSEESKPFPPERTTKSKKKTTNSRSCLLN